MSWQEQDILMKGFDSNGRGSTETTTTDEDAAKVDN